MLLSRQPTLLQYERLLLSSTMRVKEKKKLIRRREFYSSKKKTPNKRGLISYISVSRYANRERSFRIKSLLWFDKQESFFSTLLTMIRCGGQHRLN